MNPNQIFARIKHSQRQESSWKRIYPQKRWLIKIAFSLTLQSSFSGFLSPISDLTHFPDPPICSVPPHQEQRRRRDECFSQAAVGDGHKNTKRSGTPRGGSLWQDQEREAGGGVEGSARQRAACACFGFAVGRSVGWGQQGGAGDLKSEMEGSGQACVQKARAALTETAITAIGYTLITPEQIQKRSKRF